MAKGSVLLLMSGGVDSSVAGALLQQEGYDLVGVTMKLLEGEPSMDASGGCCSYGGARDAKRVAASLGIPHYTVNTAREFHERVIAPFIGDYAAGLTPNPCVRCNSFVRFEEAFAMARERGCEYAATGHYARIDRDENGVPRLRRAVCREKDQSYFLYGVRAEFLPKILFPLGGLTKEQVREKARAMGLVTAEKPESQDICFTLGRSYNEFLSRHIKNEEGPILDLAGNELGKHKGVTHYTVGQRSGLGLSGGPFYVCEIRPQRNEIVVGRREDLAVREVWAGSPRWHHAPVVGEAVLAQLRSRHAPAPARIAAISPERFAVEFEEPQYGAAPGQALVLCSGEWILGG
ncbi:MAG: tRNA 2-thiouridine(34) synthase MnmA, partial [Candidatus Omnitrophota bacterium]